VFGRGPRSIACVLANNHVLDWGRAGLSETLTTLAHLGIKTAGAGRNLDEAAAPALLDLHRKGPRPGVFVSRSPPAASHRAGRRRASLPASMSWAIFRCLGAARIAEQVERLRRPRRT